MLFFEKPDVRIAKKLLKEPILLADECYFLSTFFYKRDDMYRALYYLKKGVSLNSTHCKVAYWWAYLQDNYKAEGMTKKEFVAFQLSLAQESSNGEICYNAALELLRSKKVEDAIDMFHKAAVDDNFLAMIQLHYIYEGMDNRTYTSLYWLYKAMQHCPQENGLETTEIMRLHLKLSNQLAGADLKYLSKQAADEGCGYAVNDMEIDPGDEEMLQKYGRISLEQQVPGALYNYYYYKLMNEDSVCPLEKLEILSCRGFSYATILLADIYRGAYVDSKIAPNPDKACYFNEKALAFDHRGAIEYFIENSKGTHKDYFKYRLKQLAK